MWRKLKHAVKYKCAPLEEDIAPIPPIVFYDVVRFCFDPEVERDQSQATNPSRNKLETERKESSHSAYLVM